MSIKFFCVINIIFASLYFTIGWTLKFSSNQIRNIDKCHQIKCYGFIRIKEELLNLKLERAALLADSFSGDRVRWESSIEKLNGMFDSLPRDCLIANAFVSYLGPFISNYRDELVCIWTDAEVTFYKATNPINEVVRNHFEFARVYFY